MKYLFFMYMLLSIYAATRITETLMFILKNFLNKEYI